MVGNPPKTVQFSAIGPNKTIYRLPSATWHLAIAVGVCEQTGLEVRHRTGHSYLYHLSGFGGDYGALERFGVNPLVYFKSWRSV